MSTYAIGDVQGCYHFLEKLLEKIHFDPSKDVLWFTGDLVNRGAYSLETLRFIKQLGKPHQVVLGNHDLHLLAVAAGVHSGWPDDTLTPILTAPDREELIHWLQHQPLLHHDTLSGFTMIHAGMAANWNLAIAQQLAKEVEATLQSAKAVEFFQHMYGNAPNQWHPSLTGFDRLRCITNYFTRARLCDIEGRLVLKTAEKQPHANEELVPWFKVPHRLSGDMKIIFGHWAALGGITHTPNIYALDTGCVWGNALTAMRLEDEKRFSIACQQ